MKKMKHAIALGMSLLLGLSILTSCGGGSEKTEETGAEHSKELTVYAALPESELPVYMTAFEEETGIKVNYVRLSAGEILAKLQAEGSNPGASLWFGGPSDTFIAANDAGLLEPYQSPELSNVDTQYQDPKSVWNPLYVAAICFANNSEWFEAEAMEYPQSWDDLLKPELKGQISIAHPGASGTAYTVLAALVQLKGEDEAFDYLKKMNDNIRQYTKGGSAPPREVGLGEAAVGISFTHDCLKPADEGYPIELSFPSEGTGFEIGAVALIKNGKADELENAKAFIDFMVGEKGQGLYGPSKSFRLPINKNVPAPEGAIPLNELKLVDYDPIWAGENRERLITRFNEEIENDANLKE